MHKAVCLAYEKQRTCVLVPRYRSRQLAICYNLRTNSGDEIAAFY